MMRAVLRWVFPGGLVAASVAAAVLHGSGGDGVVEMLTRRYEVLVFVVAAGLALAFHRSRVLALVAGLAVLEAGTRYALVAPDLQPVLGTGGVMLLGLGSMARDRGVTSTGGLVQLGSALALTGGLVMGVRQRPELLQGLSPWPLPLVSEGSWGPGLVAISLSIGLVAWAAYHRRGAVERGLLWSLTMVVASALPTVEEPAISFLRMGAALTLGLAVLETSYAMAYRDELTGLPGRRSLMRDLEGLNGTYSLAMVDVDHFKKFNDKHGHDVGDQVLRLVASRLAKAPAGGRAYRYGGEEFTLLYRGRNRDGARPLLEDVRKSVAGARFSLRGWARPARKENGKAKRGRSKGGGRRANTLSVTVSIGVADSTAGSTPGEVLKKADKALYRAKRDGRDRVSI